jgi:heme exporter protein B
MSQPGLFSALRSMVVRDLTLAMRRRTDVFTTLFFFIIAVTLFPLGVGPEMEVLRNIAPGVIWVAALLASMLSLNIMFASDFEDGTLEQIILAPHPLPVLVFGKIFAHWILTGIPITVLSPLLGMQLGLDAETIKLLVITLLLGTPVLSLIGSIGAALTLGVRGGGVLLSLLILPLFVPVLIFGAGAVDAYSTGIEYAGHLSLIGAFLVLAVVLVPVATSLALRISVE